MRRRYRARALKFEKWNALGNDYVIVEQDDLPFELTPARDPRALRAPQRHRLGRHPAARRARGARLRRAAADLQPRRLGGRAVRQRRARGDHVPAPPRLDRQRHVLDRDRRRRDPADDHRARPPARVDMGARRSSSRRRRHARRATDREFAFQHVSIGNPQCSIEVPDDLGLRPADATARRSRRTPSCSRTARTSRSGAATATTRSPRASSSAAWGRRCRPAPARAAPRSPPCCKGGDSPVTVHLDGGDLEVEVGEDLHVNLTGWAVPVYSGTLVRRIRQGAE